jgi:hypothetical protein
MCCQDLRTSETRPRRRLLFQLASAALAGIGVARSAGSLFDAVETGATEAVTGWWDRTKSTLRAAMEAGDMGVQLGAALARSKVEELSHMLDGFRSDPRPRRVIHMEPVRAAAGDFEHVPVLDGDGNVSGVHVVRLRNSGEPIAPGLGGRRRLAVGYTETEGGGHFNGASDDGDESHACGGGHQVRFRVAGDYAEDVEAVAMALLDRINDRFPGVADDGDDVPNPDDPAPFTPTPAAAAALDAIRDRVNTRLYIVHNTDDERPGDEPGDALARRIDRLAGTRGLFAFLHRIGGPEFGTDGADERRAAAVH